MDLLAAGLIPDPYLDDGERRVAWVSDVDWRYETTFDWTPVEGAEVDLVAWGLDTVAEVELNGEVVARTANMHRSYHIPVASLLRAGPNALRVTFAAGRPAAYRHSDRLGPRPHVNTHPYNALRKMASNFGWDWGPDLVTAGIWRPLELRVWRRARLGAVRPLVVEAPRELSFLDVRVPIANLLGEEGSGFAQLTQKLPQERMSIAVSAVAEARGAFEETVQYVKDRKAFGTTIGSFQNTKFVLAELATEIDVAQAWVDRCVDRLNDGELSTADASKAKWWCTELQGRAIDRCLQLHGGYGYMTEYPCRAGTPTPSHGIYGGSTEIMKSVVSKSIGL